MFNKEKVNFSKGTLSRAVKHISRAAHPKNEDGRQTSSKRKLNGFKEKHYGSRY
jgi:hypothetical protein